MTNWVRDMLSPDGKFIWSGTEWIPAPPNGSSPPSIMNLTDSVIGGDVTINQSIGSEEIIGQMKNELERFSQSHSGFHIPEGGFSGAILLQGIKKIETDRSILQTFSNLQLIDFCIALEPFGYSQILVDAATIIIEKGKKSDDLELTAQGHLYKAKSLEDIFSLAESIFHADESVRISKLSDNLLTETEGMWASLRVREMTNKDIRLYDERIDQLLERSKEIDYACYCYLLASKAIYLSTENLSMSEEFEIAAYNCAKNDGDLRLEVYTALELANNEIHTISKEELVQLNEKCVINSLTMFANLTSFTIDLLDGLPHMAIGKKFIEIGETYQIPIIKVIGETVIHLLNLSDKISQLDDVMNYLEKKNVSEFFEKLIHSKMVSSDTLMVFLMLKISGVKHELVNRMLELNLESINEESKLIFSINHLIDNRAPPSQIQHMFIIGKNDSKGLMDVKHSLHKLYAAIIIASGDSFSYTEIDPNNYLELDSSQKINNQAMELSSVVNNEQWGQALHLADRILLEKNHLMSDRTDMWILGSTLQVLGISYFNLERFEESMKSLDESMFWNEKSGEDTSVAQELIDHISNTHYNRAPLPPLEQIDNFANLNTTQTSNGQSENVLCLHCYKRPKTTGATAYTVRGYLIMVEHGKSWAVGCPTCMRLHLLKETFWNFLFGWWGIKAFIMNCITIPINLISIIFVKNDPEKLQQVALEIRINSD